VSSSPIDAAPRVAVLIPCYNEEVSIPTVVAAFRDALPDATVHVYDNNSSDATVDRARQAGAVVRREPRQGKGHVVRRMFADVDADVYVLVDGDATYDAPSAPAMVARLWDEQLDMVVGRRVHEDEDAYRAGHQTGNRALTGFLGRLFGRQFTDILSGYRVFSRRFVKTFPAEASGFEIETELSVHALELRLPLDEVDTPYRARLDGSESKLSTWSDGFRILWTMVRLYESERPRQFFSIIAGVLAVVAIVLAIPIVIEYAETGLVPRFPTAILASALGLLASFSFFAGSILETVTLGRREAKRLAYLAQPVPGGSSEPR
jgi:glycosyltransferase involved in cell wall biosynthesis